MHRGTWVLILAASNDDNWMYIVEPSDDIPDTTLSSVRVNDTEARVITESSCRVIERTSIYCALLEKSTGSENVMINFSRDMSAYHELT